jgi:hypothetical protein
MTVSLHGDSGAVIKVSLITTRFSELSPYKSGWRWGAEASPLSEALPLVAVTDLDVRYNGERIFVPLSAFADLANPHDLQLTQTPQGFSLKIVGGDAAVGYTARLDFSEDRILLRRVEHGEFPEVVWEEITFSFHSGEIF